MFDINGWELIIIGLLAMVLIGPERLPEYVNGLKGLVKQVRALLKQGKTLLDDELGDESQWRQYDPRQYDPRRIVREALAEPDEEELARRKAARAAGPAAAAPAETPVHPAPAAPAPYDDEAT